MAASSSITLPRAAAPPRPDAVRLYGVRQNNLKGFDLDIRIGRLTVVTGLSGSGKSSLAFDTLYAEGQRRYIETFTPYARQFFDRMDKPAVDRIENIPPAIAVEQRNAVRTTRSTVGTMTELCDYMKVVWPHVAALHCRKCGDPVGAEPPQTVAERLIVAGNAGCDVVVTFELPLTEKLPLAEQLELVGRQGYQRIWTASGPVRLEEAPAALGAAAATLVVVAGRVRLEPARKGRLVELCEQAYHFGQGRLGARVLRPGAPDAAAHAIPFSLGLHCARCDIRYAPASPALFSFNNPVGACPECKGFGRVITIDPNLALPDRAKTLREGVVRPWQSGVSAECQKDLLKAAKREGVPLDVPFLELSQEHQRWVMEGEPGYGEGGREWPAAWYGVRGYFRWLESQSYKMHMRVLLSRYRSYHACPKCGGRRLNDDALLYRWSDEASAVSLADFYRLPVRDARAAARRMADRFEDPRHPVAVALGEVRSRLDCLDEIGLGYLTLDRATRTLSGGETERVNLTTCLGARLVNTLFVLDEPSVGLHPRDTERLVRLLRQLRDAGNTVVVVEHEAAVMRAADYIVDLGPGRGEQGGSLVYAGPAAGLAASESSLTAAYLSGRRSFDARTRRPVAPKSVGGSEWLSVKNVRAHNLKGFDADIPLGRLVAVTGVSGSGKTSLVRDELIPRLQRHFGPPGAADDDENADSEAASDSSESNSAGLAGAGVLAGFSVVDQTPAARTPRSNPAVYLGAFDDLREVFAASPEARSRQLVAGAFSFNSKAGQCERCTGAGFEKIEMQFLSDVYLRCPACAGRRYRESILAVRIPGTLGGNPVQWSIADLLEASVDDARAFLAGIEGRRAARAGAMLGPLADVGLGYVRLGQPLNTLSGGESQRLKLARHLAEFAASGAGDRAKPTLFLLDEPTTGLHFDDVRILLGALEQLVDRGHSVVVIEHNLDVIRAADWILDLGPDAGDLGGGLVVAGTPSTVAAHRSSHTGRFLRTGSETARQ
jgi:excinuclease ABC subunit A